MIKRIFVTGATGFVGSNIVHMLVSKKYHVAVLTRSKILHWRLKDIYKSVTVYSGDILHVNLKNIIDREKPDAIIHFAAYGSLPHESDFEAMIDVNLKGTKRLLDACNKTSVKLFIHTGTSSEYGVKAKAMNESDILKPINDYGVVKSATTLLCQKYAITSSYAIIVMRLFSPYGPYEDPSRFIPTLLMSALTNKTMVASNPNYVRDFIYIDDVARAYIQVLKMKGSIVNGQIVNIGSGNNYRLHSVTSILEKITKKKIHILWNSKDKQKRQLEPRMWKSDIHKAGKILHWRPKTSVPEGLKLTLKYLRKNIKNYSKSV